MKYLKPFNEKFNISDLEEYCNNYLAYLLDEEDFYLEYIDSRMISQCRYTEPIIKLKTKKPNYNWDDIKDYFIPFINITSKEYNIKDILINDMKVKIHNILKDDISTYWFMMDKIFEIEIRFSLNQDKYRAKRGL